MALGDTYLKELDTALKGLESKLKEELGMVRSNRPSPELVENIRVIVYDQNLPINQLGSISVMPPRGLVITVWDQSIVGAVMNAIDAARMGLSCSNDGSPDGNRMTSPSA